MKVHRMTCRWILACLVAGVAIGFMGRPWVVAQERGRSVVELFSGDRLEVRHTAKGTGLLVRRAVGEGRPERFEVSPGEELIFEVSHDPPTESDVRILRALDGDTIVVDLHGREERVRLLGVDTPEIFGDYYSVEAWEKTIEVAVGKRGRLVYDSNQRTGDLGRDLGWLFTLAGHVRLLHHHSDSHGPKRRGSAA